ncbi:MAG: hypothetical protein ACRD4V_08960, partial [Candidatus Acidiferrales bacterium]
NFISPMLRINPLAIGSMALVLFCASPSLLTTVPQTNSTADPRDAATLLARTTAHLNIESPSSAPFVLFAKARYTINKQTVEGTYSLGWAAPNVYREDLRYGQSQDTIIVSNGKLYRAPAQEEPHANLWSQMIKRALHWSLPAGTRAKERPQGEHWQSAARLTCIVADASGRHERICLDPVNYEPFTYDVSGPSGKQTWTFADYTSLAHAVSDSQRFPSAITYRDNSGVSAELDVQSIEVVPGFAANEFTPPANAAVQPFPGHNQRQE